jgi:predicted NUDIX family NTP pyrophosphohydrolase
MFRGAGEELEFLLAHPGGPFWENKDLGAWTIPKGEIHPGETPLAAALREFQEEIGCAAKGPFIELQPVRQRGGKVVMAWAFRGDWNPAELKSNSFKMCWPASSSQVREFPEIDRAAFFRFEIARQKINVAQVAFLEETVKRASSSGFPRAEPVVVPDAKRPMRD